MEGGGGAPSRGAAARGSDEPFAALRARRAADAADRHRRDGRGRPGTPAGHLGPARRFQTRKVRCHGSNSSGSSSSVSLPVALYVFACSTRAAPFVVAASAVATASALLAAQPPRRR